MVKRGGVSGSDGPRLSSPSADLAVVLAPFRFVRLSLVPSRRVVFRRSRRCLCAAAPRAACHYDHRDGRATRIDPRRGVEQQSRTS